MCGDFVTETTRVEPLTLTSQCVPLSAAVATGGFAVSLTGMITLSSIPLLEKLPSNAAQRRTTVGERKMSRIGMVDPAEAALVKEEDVAATMLHVAPAHFND